jgi:hypothetical protein
MEKLDIKAKAETFTKLEKELRSDIKKYLLKVLEGTDELDTMVVDITIETDSEFPTFNEASTLTEMWLNEDDDIVFFLDDSEMYFEELSTYELVFIVKELEV